MGRTSLGDLEQLVLLAIGRLQPTAYAVSIVDEIAARTDRAPTQASIYVVLGRLEDKGYLTSRLGDATTGRGGRPRRFYALTEQAIERLRVDRANLMRMWDDLEWVSE